MRVRGLAVLALLLALIVVATHAVRTLEAEVAVASCDCTPVEIPADQDLNTYQTTGVFIQSESEEGSAWANYPGKTQRAGKLEVVANSRFVWQQFVEYSSGPRQPAPRVWERTFKDNRNPPWTSWNQTSGAPLWYQAVSLASGWQGSVPDPIPPAGKWGLALKDFQVSMRFQATRSSAIASDASGSFPSNVAVGTITDPRFWPSTDVIAPVNVLGRATAWALIRPNGDILLTHVTAPSTTFNAGAEFEFSGSYSINDDD